MGQEYDPPVMTEREPGLLMAFDRASNPMLACVAVWATHGVGRQAVLYDGPALLCGYAKSQRRRLPWAWVRDWVRGGLDLGE
jgi:hypothetical protein